MTERGEMRVRSKVGVESGIQVRDGWRGAGIGARVAGIFGLAGVTLGMVVAVLGASLIGPFILFAVPLIALFGVAAGPLHALLVEPGEWLAPGSGVVTDIPIEHRDAADRAA